MMSRFLGVGCVALVAMATACSSTVDSVEPGEAVESSSQALGECTHSVKAFAGNFTTDCNTVTATKAITELDVAVLHTRAQAYFAYIMGGPIPSGTVSIAGGASVNVRDSYWSDNGRGTGARLCAIRNAIKADRSTNGVTVTNMNTTVQICAKDAMLFRFNGTILPADGTPCGLSLPAGGVGLGSLIATLGRNQQAERGWCVQDGIDGSQTAVNVPSFFNVSYINTLEAIVDPEPVTLRSGLSTTATTASAEGVDSLRTYTAYRFSSGLCGSALNTLMDSAMYGVPCSTTSASTGAVITKYIKRTGSGSTAFCVCL